ncbi:UNVERIFIED_CONTAM: Glucan endo-1,3-beta-glucosidase 5 [Sesamum radiatum]|uniref:Glucan endo-1,3-beta-glucosidase 5 n=1 Tax=Sesamum radiatum TaxID=300843 RepID=A0AAW2KIH3_SESRA
MSVLVVVVESGIGVNWGTISFHRLSPETVVDLLKDNKIGKVKLFDADPTVMRALMGSGIEVMVGIPNEMLAVLSSSAAASDLWVSQNVSRYMVKGGVNIKYVAVGNEPFLTSYSGQFQSLVMPALMNLQQSLVKVNLAGMVKLVVPCNADAYESSLPSQGAFRPELTQIITQLVSFLNQWFTFCSEYLPFPKPLSPNLDMVKCLLLLERGEKCTPGNFERHWGIFSFDGQAKYPLNLGNGLLKNAKQVDYLPSRWCVANPNRDLSAVTNHFKLACNVADCTTLSYGGSCNDIGEQGNISYAFNSYYQLKKQNPQSCDFDGLGMVTFLDPSVGDCKFLVGVTDNNSLGFILNGVEVGFSGFPLLKLPD